MSLLTTVQEATPGNYYFQLDGGTTNALPSGFIVAPSWSAGPAGSGTFFTTVPVPGATTSSIFSVTASSFAGNIADALAAWVVTAYGTTLAGGGLIVYVATLPENNANFFLSWACLKL